MGDDAVEPAAEEEVMMVVPPTVMDGGGAADAADIIINADMEAGDDVFDPIPAGSGVPSLMASCCRCCWYKLLMLTMPADAGERRSSTPWAKVQPLNMQMPVAAKLRQMVVLNLPCSGGSEGVIWWRW